MHQLMSIVFDRSFNLKVAEWHLMATLHEAGPITQAEISRLQRTDKVAISRMVIALQKRGLLVRTLGGRDNRHQLVALTAPGETMVYDALDKLSLLEELLFKDFDEGEMSTLRKGLQKLRLATDNAQVQAVGMPPSSLTLQRRSGREGLTLSELLRLESGQSVPSE
ncbi:hypothetical protein ATDW_36830 (plasmid) [Asticcacaulis sp. DW145]|nr:hypothetical protein ATDW_36830 [Asticcacaulis sp. DW145]